MLFVFVSIVFVQAQDDVERALKGIHAFYNGHPHVYQEINYNLYPDHHTTVPYSTEKGILVINQQARYARLANIESLVTESFIIAVDQDEQILVISNNSSGMNFDPLGRIQPYLQGLNSAVIYSVSPQINRLTLKMEIGEVKQVDIFYDKASFQLDKITMTYRREIQLEDASDADWVKPRLEIMYTKTEFGHKGKALLQLDQYVSRTRDTYKPAGRYAGYDLINNIYSSPIK